MKRFIEWRNFSSIFGNLYEELWYLKNNECIASIMYDQDNKTYRTSVYSWWIDYPSEALHASFEEAKSQLDERLKSIGYVIVKEKHKSFL